MALEGPLGVKIGLFREFDSSKSIFSLDTDVKFYLEALRTHEKGSGSGPPLRYHWTALEEPPGAKISIFWEFDSSKSIFSLDINRKFCLEVLKTHEKGSGSSPPLR